MGTPGLDPFGDAPHLRSPCGELSAWFTEPPGVVVRYSGSGRLELSSAQWLTGPALASMDERFGTAAKVVIVLDLRGMTSRDPAVRSLIVEAAKSLQPRLERAMLIPPEEAPAVYLASLRAAASVLRVFGVEVDVKPSLVEVLRTVSLTAAP